MLTPPRSPDTDQFILYRICCSAAVAPDYRSASFTYVSLHISHFLGFMLLLWMKRRTSPEACAPTDQTSRITAQKTQLYNFMQ